MKKSCLKKLALSLIVSIIMGGVSHAQSEVDVSEEEIQNAIESTNTDQMDLNNAEGIAEEQDTAALAQALAAQTAPPQEQKRFNPSDYNSVVFTFWEHAAIKDAIASVGTMRPVTEEELMRDLASATEDQVKPPPEEREVRLGGVLYKASNDWVLWLNEERITPNAIPKEIMDLRVFKDYIELKWFDEYTNQIFPIRMRPHQRFHLDYQNFLPG